jgi:hypothetical protein
MKGWYRAIMVIASTLIVVLALPPYAMTSDKQVNTSQYRLEYVTPKTSKLRLTGEALRKLNGEEAIVATVKVSLEGYVPSGLEVRTRISPSIFTANIPPEIWERLEQDPAVMSIEPAYNLRPSSEQNSSPELFP